jgi:mono/diheme cytochrome c family protein
VQKRTDGELFWVVQNGIRMTGMPAFGPTHKDEEIWKIVAFLRHLPALTPEEEKALSAGAKRD